MLLNIHKLFATQRAERQQADEPKTHLVFKTCSMPTTPTMVYTLPFRKTLLVRYLRTSFKARASLECKERLGKTLMI